MLEPPHYQRRLCLGTGLGLGRCLYLRVCVGGLLVWFGLGLSGLVCLVLVGALCLVFPYLEDSWFDLVLFGSVRFGSVGALCLLCSDTVGAPVRFVLFHFPHTHTHTSAHGNGNGNGNGNKRWTLAKIPREFSFSYIFFFFFFFFSRHEISLFVGCCGLWFGLVLVWL